MNTTQDRKLQDAIQSASRAEIHLSQRTQGVEKVSLALRVDARPGLPRRLFDGQLPAQFIATTATFTVKGTPRPVPASDQSEFPYVIGSGKRRVYLTASEYNVWQQMYRAAAGAIRSLRGQLGLKECAL